MKKLNKKGFTLVELVIVIAVIAILAAVLIPVFSSIIGNAKESKVMQNARNAFEEYMATNAKELKGDEDLMIKVVDGTTTYWFKAENLQFNNEKLDSGYPATTYADQAALQAANPDTGTYYVAAYSVDNGPTVFVATDYTHQ